MAACRLRLSVEGSRFEVFLAKLGFENNLSLSRRFEIVCRKIYKKSPLARGSCMWICVDVHWVIYDQHNRQVNHRPALGLRL